MIFESQIFESEDFREADPVASIRPKTFIADAITGAAINSDVANANVAYIAVFGPFSPDLTANRVQPKFRSVSGSIIADLGKYSRVATTARLSGVEWVPKWVNHDPTLPRVSYSRCRIFEPPMPDEVSQVVSS